MSGVRDVLRGWVKMPRYIMNSPIFENERALKVYVWCRLRANPKPKDVGQVHLERGQLLTSAKDGAHELNMSPSAFHRWLKKLESEKLVKRFVGSHYTIVTVVDYDVSEDSKQNGGMQSGKQNQHPAKRKVGTEEEVLLRNSKKDLRMEEGADAPVPSEPVKPEGWDEAEWH